MFLSDASVKRPVAMSCLFIALTILGTNAWRKMSLELMPSFSIPFITIVTIYPGASPEEIEVDVAKRIEDAVGKISGLKNITSTCMSNVHQALLEFEMGKNVDIVATEVSRQLDTILPDLPVNAEKPQVQTFDVNSTAVVTFALTGDVPLDELYDYADNEMSDRLTVIPGVAKVELTGGAEREVHILLDRDAVAARGLTSMDIVRTVQNGLGKTPAGNIRGGGVEYTVKYDADFRAVEELGSLEIVNDAGRRCYLRDVATVSMSTEELRKTARLDGRQAVAVKVYKREDANAVRVVDQVRVVLDKMRQTMPGGMELVWVTDDATFIRASNSSAWVNVAQGIVLTAAVLFFFLYDLRALLVVSISMPLTVVIGLFFIQAAGFSLNMATLIAIGMSVGILVTNSIVVMEAIFKCLHDNHSPREASIIGASDSFIPVLASAGTNLVVLFPLAMMKSKVAEFIRPLALTMLIMTLVSLFISFTLTPMLCSLLLRPQHKKARFLIGLESKWNKGFDWITERLRAILAFNECHRWAAFGMILLTAVMFWHALTCDVGFGFFPEPDRGEFYLKLEYPTDYDLQRTEQLVRQVEERLSDLPHLRHMLTTCGRVQGVVGQSSEGVYLAQLLLRFNERTEREMTAFDLLSEIRRRVSDLPGQIATVTVASIIGGQSTPIEMEISGEDLTLLDRLAEQSAELAKGTGTMVDVDTTVRAGKPELRVLPKREVLSDLQTPARALGYTLRGNIEGLNAGSFTSGDRNYDIVVKFAEKPGLQQVAAFELPGKAGRPIRLDTVARIESGVAPIQIIRKNKMRIAKLYASLKEGVPLGTAVNSLSAAMDERGNLPPGYDYYFAGEYEVMHEANVGFLEALLLSILLVVLTLAAILESFRQPWLILVTLPLGLIGVLWSLALMGLSMDMFAVMGLVMLIGIVVNNAILIMDQFNEHVKEGVSRHKAMISATCERFRPVVMITIAAVLGMLPLAVGRGIGAEIRNGVGVASVGGILVSGVLTLFLLPVIYDLFTRRQRAKQTAEPR